MLKSVVVRQTREDAKPGDSGKNLAGARFSPSKRIVTPLLPACPYLPSPPAVMTWRDLAAERARRGERFYLTALTYGNYLWQRRLPARAILCLDRAFGADLSGTEPVLSAWPLPYAAMAWMLAHAPADVFIGNPRVHFQHYAGRMNEPRREQRRWRAWACWALARKIMPDLPGDPRHVVEEPTAERIVDELARRGHAGEAQLWSKVYASLA